MAFEIVKIPEGTDKRILMGYFSSGQALCFEDYSRGEAEIVSIICRSDEHGGEVYIFPKEQLGTDDPDRVQYMGADPVVNKVENIEPNGTYEHHKVDEKGNRELAIFKHMAPFVLRAAGLDSFIALPMN